MSLKGVEIGEELKKHRYVEVEGMAKSYNGKLILQVANIRTASEDEFDKNDINRIPSKEELEVIRAQLWPHAQGYNMSLNWKVGKLHERKISRHLQIIL